MTPDTRTLKRKKPIASESSSEDDKPLASSPAKLKTAAVPMPGAVQATTTKATTANGRRASRNTKTIVESEDDEDDEGEGLGMARARAQRARGEGPSTNGDDRLLERNWRAPRGKRIAVPVRIEPKVYFAAERTFFVSLLLSSVLDSRTMLTRL